MVKRKRTPATRGEILAVAERCFAATGYGGTSINDVAAATRYTKPVLYYHFGSKAGLFHAVLEQAYDHCFAILQDGARRADSVEQKLVNIVAGMFDFLRDRKDLTRLAFSAAFAAPNEIPKGLRNDDHRRRNFQFIKAIIELGLRRGELDPAFGAHALTCGIYGAMSFHLMASVVFPGTKLNRQTARRIVSLFLNGARPRA